MAVAWKGTGLHVQAPETGLHIPGHGTVNASHILSTAFHAAPYSQEDVLPVAMTSQQDQSAELVVPSEGATHSLSSMAFTCDAV